MISKGPNTQRLWGCQEGFKAQGSPKALLSCRTSESGPGLNERGLSGAPGHKGVSWNNLETVEGRVREAPIQLQH